MKYIGKLLGVVLVLVGLYNFYFNGWNIGSMFLILVGVDIFVFDNYTKLGRAIHKLIFVTSVILFVLVAIIFLVRNLL